MANETWYLPGRSWETGEPEVRAVIVTKVTESCLWIGGRKRNKRSSYEAYYPTFEAALDAMITESTNRIEQAQQTLESEGRWLKLLKNLTKPTEAGDER